MKNILSRRVIIQIWIAVAAASASSSASASLSTICQKLLGGPLSELNKKRLDYYNPLKLLESNSIDASRMITEEFYKPTGRGAIVGINGYVGVFADHNRPNSDYLAGKPFADMKEVFSFKTEDLYSFIQQLRRVYHNAGPIHRLLIMGHGAPGQIEIGREILSQEWAERNWETLNELPRDLFAPDAEIVLLSCECAKGNILNPDRGTDAIKKIFRRLARQGATVYASRKVIIGHLRGFDKTPAMLTAEHAADVESRRPGFHAKMIPQLMVMVPFTILSNVVDRFLLDHESKFGNPVSVITIPPR